MEHHAGAVGGCECVAAGCDAASLLGQREGSLDDVAVLGRLGVNTGWHTSLVPLRLRDADAFEDLVKYLRIVALLASAEDREQEPILFDGMMNLRRKTATRATGDTPRVLAFTLSRPMVDAIALELSPAKSTTMK